MSRVQLALRVADLEASIAFYSKLFGTEPAKRREGYANIAVTEPPLKLVLIEGEAGEDTRLDHLGVEVASTEDVAAATARLTDAWLCSRETGLWLKFRDAGTLSDSSWSYRSMESRPKMIRGDLGWLTV
ncbi:VOC family protein [Streptomyces sp. NPDC001970]